MEIKALKDDPVIVDCRTDKRSTKAATILRDNGFRDVCVMRGSMAQWNRIGLPVESRPEANSGPATAFLHELARQTKEGPRQSTTRCGSFCSVDGPTYTP